MKKSVRRIYVSILLVVLSLFTGIATTFAWVGITSNNTFDKFRINLRANDEEEQSEYGIQLSLTGQANDFHDEIQAEDLYRQILLNMGYTNNVIKRAGGATTLFRSIKLYQCTTARQSLEYPSTNTRLHGFYDMSGTELVTSTDANGDFVTGKGFIFFDIYLAIYSISDSVTSVAPSIFLKKDVLTSDNCSTQILNNIKLDNYFGNITGKVNINAANACRVAFQRFNIVEKGDLNAYKVSGGNNPNMLRIYQTGSLMPKYSAIDNFYDFGGIMPLGDNFAYKYYKSIYGDTFNNLNEILEYDRIMNRGDVVFENGSSLSSNNMILPYKPTGENTKDGGITSKDMVKFRVYFWFEGWDGDCIDAINNIPVSLNIMFTTKTNAE